MKKIQTLIVVAAACCLAGSPVLAQGTAPTTQPGFGAATGIVVDSLRGGVLSGAIIMVDGVNRSAMTDFQGRFVLDSVAPGTYRLVLMDAVLDSLALTIVTPPITFTAGDTVHLVMAVPSAATVLRAKCGPGPFPGGGTSALLGLVTQSETGEPAADASILVAWTEISVGVDIGVRQMPRQRTTRSESDGSFRVCGLPADLDAEVIAWFRGDTTTSLPVSLGNAPLRIVSLALPSPLDELVIDTVPSPAPGVPPAAVTLRRGRSVLAGRVTTLGGTPIRGARVNVSGAVGVAVTNDRGEFILNAQPSGSRAVVVRRLGFQPAEFAVNLSPNARSEVTVTLAEFVPILAPVVVQSRMDVGLDRVGFTRRQRSGLGRYMTLEDIERLNAVRLIDVLSRVPGLSTAPGYGSERVLLGRFRGGQSGCITYYVDSMPWVGAGSPNDFMQPEEIGAVEVYSSGTAPAEYSRSNCDVILLWTKARLNIGPR